MMNVGHPDRSGFGPEAAVPNLALARAIRGTNRHRANGTKMTRLILSRHFRAGGSYAFAKEPNYCPAPDVYQEPVGSLEIVPKDHFESEGPYEH